MEMDEGLRVLILMAVSFIYGFFMRHMITVPVKRKGATDKYMTESKPHSPPKKR